MLPARSSSCTRVVAILPRHVIVPPQHSHGHVLVLGKDGVVRLETVLLKVLGSVLGGHLDVELAVSWELEVVLGSRRGRAV